MVAGDYVNPDSHVESDSAIPSDTGLDIEDTVLGNLHSSTWLDEEALELLKDLGRQANFDSSVGQGYRPSA